MENIDIKAIITLLLNAPANNVIVLTLLGLLGYSLYLLSLTLKK